MSSKVHDIYFTEVDFKGKGFSIPDKFTFPMCYEPHPIAIYAAERLQEELKKENSWNHSFGLDGLKTGEDFGKMFGVLIVKNQEGKTGFLKAYSGKLEGVKPQEGFVPLLYDRFSYEGFFNEGVRKLNQWTDEIDRLVEDESYLQRKRDLTQRKVETEVELASLKEKIREEKKSRKNRREAQFKSLPAAEYEKLLEDLIKESYYWQYFSKKTQSEIQESIDLIQREIDNHESKIKELKQRRAIKSSQIQQKLFDQYNFLNILGEEENVVPIFQRTPLEKPPAGAGDCAAPKLLQYAFKNGYFPLALAEFWWGESPKSEIRQHKNYYPACRGKCEPILGHMLKGLPLDDNPLEQLPDDSKQIKVVYEDDFIVVVNKPHELLSVPGRTVSESVYTRMKEKYPHAEGPLLLHRLDMSTSGLLLIALDKDSHRFLQEQFLKRTVKKRYVALLDGRVEQRQGEINLPLIIDYLNRPMQMVDFQNGKPAKTHWEVLGYEGEYTRVHFYPVTGRTHQLRVHAAHADGLNTPIVGDEVYGKRKNRLHLHAEYLEIVHPKTRKKMKFSVDPDF